MLLEQVNRDVTQSSLGRTATATIKASRKLFSFFSDGVYSNKAEAIVRELVANGVDSHTMSGQPTLPVRVILPTELEPTFSVTDTGLGMSEDFIFDQYMVYADGSTKDNSNEAIGGFGIGKAAVFSYTDQFTLQSVFDGVLTIYSVFINEDGIPAASVMAQTTTSDHNGVSISFPVQSEDIAMFHEAAQTALQYFNPLPIVENGTLVGPKYSYVGDKWAMRPEAGPLGVVLGGVRYPVVTSSLPYTLRNDREISSLLEYGLDLTMDIGSVSIALSREQLQYTSKTVEGITAALKNVLTGVVATFATMFDQAVSLWDAIDLLEREVPSGSGKTARSTLLAKNALYKGEPLSRFFDLNVDPAHVEDRIWTIETLIGKRRTTVGSSSFVSLGTTARVYPGKTSVVIIDDMEKNSIGRIRAYIEDKRFPKNALVLRLDDRNVQRALDLLNNPSDYVLTSSLPVPPKVSKKGSGTVRPRVRMFSFDGSRTKSKYGSTELTTNLTLSQNKKGVQEIPYAAQPAAGLLVTMKNFQLPNVRKFYDIMETGLIKYDEVYYVNESDAVKIKDNFTDFFVEFEKRLKVALSAYPNLAQRIAISKIGEFSEVFGAWKQVRKQMSVAQLRRPFGQIGALYDKYVVPLDDDQLRLKKFVSEKLPKNINPKDMIAKMEEQQPDVVTLLDVLDMKEFDQRRVLVNNL